MNSFSRYLLLADWTNERKDIGSHVFRAGKLLAILGRSLGPVLLLAAILGSAASSTVLAFVAYGAGLTVIALVLVEVLARCLMLAGNAMSSHSQRRG